MSRLAEEMKKKREGSVSEPSSRPTLKDVYRARERGEELKAEVVLPETDPIRRYVSDLNDSDAITKYADVYANADFASKSKGEKRGLLSQLGADVKSIFGNDTDRRYDEVNNEASDYALSDLAKGTFMTSNERSLFNYLYNTGSFGSSCR